MISEEKIKRIVKEEYSKLVLEDGKTEGMKQQMEAAQEQLKGHADFLQNAVAYLTIEEDDSETAKELVKAHGRYLSTIKEILNSI